jgi:hypothetical protein
MAADGRPVELHPGVWTGAVLLGVVVYRATIWVRGSDNQAEKDVAAAV